MHWHDDFADNSEETTYHILGSRGTKQSDFRLGTITLAHVLYLVRKEEIETDRTFLVRWHTKN
jgi:hypothetical protein